MTQTLSKNGQELLKQLEGKSLKVYLCSAGVSTIGFGHAIAGKASLERYKKYGITEEEALCLFRGDVSIAEDKVNRTVKVPLSQNQFDALVCLLFNIKFSEWLPSRALKYLNANNPIMACIEMFSKEKGWVHVNGVKNRGLINRRQIERDLFNAN
jgi:lysozyme